MGVVKNILATLSVALGVALVAGEDLSLCKKHLHNSVVHVRKFDVSPDTPTAGSNVEFTISGSADEPIVEGTVAKVILQTLGIEVALNEFDVCSLEGVSCPIAAQDTFDATISHKLPFQLPDGVSIEVAVEFVHDEKVLGCYEVEMKVMDARSHANRFGFDLEEAEFLFKAWQKKHGITFKSAAEAVKRKAIFVENLIKIALHNAKNGDWSMGMNQFGHLKPEEFKKIYASGLLPPSLKNLRSTPSFRSNITRAVYRRMENEQLPTEVNWITAGAVTPVKNQGACGSCWSFSTTGALEGAYFIANKKLVSFSEQELVACDPVDQGCRGGLMDNAYEWIEKNGGLCSEDSYPYTSGQGQRGMCKKSGCKIVPNSAPSKFFDVPHSEASLESAVAKQPVAIAIEADQTAFQFYQKGVLTAKCGANLDHGVLVVGYGTEDGQDYWLVKNSWGATWGDHGYIKLARGLKQQGGECGILLSPSYPVFPGM